MTDSKVRLDETDVAEPLQKPFRLGNQDWVVGERRYSKISDLDVSENEKVINAEKR